MFTVWPLCVQWCGQYHAAGNAERTNALRQKCEKKISFDSVFSPHISCFAPFSISFFLASTNGKIYMVALVYRTVDFPWRAQRRPIDTLSSAFANAHPRGERTRDRETDTAPGFAYKLVGVEPLITPNDKMMAKIAPVCELQRKEKTSNEKIEQIMQSKLDQEREDALASWNGGGNTMKIRMVRDRNSERARERDGKGNAKWQINCLVESIFGLFNVHESFAFASRTMAWTAAAARCHSGRTKCQEPFEHTHTHK